MTTLKISDVSYCNSVKIQNLQEAYEFMKIYKDMCSYLAIDHDKRLKETESICNSPYWRNRKEEKTMPKIVDYSYTAIPTSGNPGYTDIMVTTIKWSNGDETVVKCPAPQANQVMGFYAAVAKYAMGNNNTVNNQLDYWTEKKPKRDKAAEEKAKRKAEMEANIRRKKEAALTKARQEIEAKKIAERYAAKKLANKLYGVPMDFKD